MIPYNVGDIVEHADGRIGRILKIEPPAKGSHGGGWNLLIAWVESPEQTWVDAGDLLSYDDYGCVARAVDLRKD